ncbi:response regulator [Hansschlegelia quercus]|uniref:histidine kinase n=1 Tax=Hansschlegelia quercus TaxID=2528245 RepID=A0A4Q9GMA7_9HYPH|nr:response regulator [Hansschlegelia quercus]TBN51838.1 response regulator [Hansschlegelia quercus]
MTSPARQAATATEAAVNDRQRLLESESWFDALAESSPQIVWSATPDGQIDYVNPRWFAYTGAEPVAPSLEDWMERLHPDDRSEALERWRASLAAGDAYQTEYRLRSRDGTWRWFLAKAWPRRDAAGEIKRWFGVATDIQDVAKGREEAAAQGVALERLVAQQTADLAMANQRAASEAAGRRVERSERRNVDALYAAYIDNTPDGVFVMSVSSGGEIRAETLNRMLEKAFDVRREAVQGRPLADFMPDDMAARLVAKIGESVRTRAPARYEEIVEIQGVQRVFEVSLAPVFGTAGAPFHVVGSARDLTERREAEQQLRQAQKMEAVGQLTGGIAHDFNNLLQVVKGNLDLLAHELEGAATPAMERRLKDAMAGAARGAKLTRQLLAFSRRQPLTPRPTDVGALVQSMTELLDRSLGETIEVSMSVPSESWTALVDPAQLENAVLNLAINARDAMENGGALTIAVANRPGLTTEQDAIEIAVSDTGSGMPPSVLARVFEPFFSTKPEGRGTGLGLPQVQGFIEQSHGRIAIDSAPGQGTTVRLSLPRSQMVIAEEEEELPPLGETRGRGERILVLEDDDAVRAAVADLLVMIGYSVRQAVTTREAAALLDGQEPFDLLLSDVVMPGTPTPPDLARLARLARPSLKVLFMSGYAEDAIVHQGRVDPDVHLIEKPYRKEALALRLRQLLDARPRPPAAASDGPPRVLMVEDEPMIALAMADLVGSFGYEVVEAHNGTMAKAAFDKYDRIDVMLTDLGLPDIDGHALAEWARARRPGLPIVFSTGRDEFEVPPLLAEGGRVHVVQKPFDSETLRRTLESCAPLPA